MITEAQLQQAKATFEKVAAITSEKHHAIIYRYGLKRLDILASEGTLQRYRMERDPKFWAWFQRDYHQKNIALMSDLGINPYDPTIQPQPFETEALRDGARFIHTPVQGDLITFPAKCLVK